MQNPCTIFSRTNKGFVPSSFRDGKKGREWIGASKCGCLFFCSGGLIPPSFGEVFPERGWGEEKLHHGILTASGAGEGHGGTLPSQGQVTWREHEPVCPEDIQLFWEIKNSRWERCRECGCARVFSVTLAVFFPRWVCGAQSKSGFLFLNQGDDHCAAE